MADQNRRSAPDLNTDPAHAMLDDLLANGPAYTFLQAVRLLRKHTRGNGGEKEGARAPIRVRPALDLAFPAADISSIKTIENDPQRGYRITANFMGIYGVSSPLPTFYSEDLIAEAGQDESVSRDFIDMIHQRLYDLFFQTSFKYRQFFQVAEQQSEPHFERLYALLGLDRPALRSALPESKRLLRYIGLLTQFPRSGAGLTALLQDSLSNVPINLVPCVKRMAPIPHAQRIKMGLTGSALGKDTYIGREIEDRMGKFRIQIGPLTQSDFLRFTPGATDYARLTALTQLYITQPLEYEIELILEENHAQTVCLGDRHRSGLGVSSWVFSEPALGQVAVRFAATPSNERRQK